MQRILTSIFDDKSWKVCGGFWFEIISDEINFNAKFAKIFLKLLRIFFVRKGISFSKENAGFVIGTEGLAIK
ncbi:hypothetical protein [Chryseobacterium wanjuense]|uniref:hypothetical protein n=1 Tax=Chryseobacterium wanjuense TaxID=356305 RepID=UPI0011142948|nr:hypothetical protein [Chryseobacterium wanjuense]